MYEWAVSKKIRGILNVSGDEFQMYDVVKYQQQGQASLTEMIVKLDTYTDSILVDRSFKIEIPKEKLKRKSHRVWTTQ